MGEVIRRTQGGRFLGWYLRWYEAGRRRVMASQQSSFAEAKRMLIELEARVARGELSIPERRLTGPTFRELSERFLTEYSRPRIKDPQRYRALVRSVLKRVLPYLGPLRADRIQAADIAQLRDGLSHKLAAGSVRNTLTCVGVVFAWAVGKGLVSANPCKGVERPAAAQALDFLSRDEVKRLLGAAESSATSTFHRMRHLGIALAVHTGLRKGELLGLRWIDLDLEARRLTVARSYRGAPKSGKARHLRIPESVSALLAAWRPLCPSSPEGAVLPLGRSAAKVGGREVMLGLRKLMAELGLRAVPHPWHLLRHTFASHFVMAGGNILALQQILGHADVKVTQIYAHLAPDFLDGEMEKVRF